MSGTKVVLRKKTRREGRRGCGGGNMGRNGVGVGGRKEGRGGEREGKERTKEEISLIPHE